MGPKPGNIFGHCKITSAVLVSYFRGIITFILKWNEEHQIMNCCSLQKQSSRGVLEISQN